MKRILLAIATSAFIIPLSFANGFQYCPHYEDGILQPYSVQRVNAQGQLVTLTFGGTAQTGFCRVLSYWGA